MPTTWGRRRIRGHRPPPRSGYDLSGLRGRQVQPRDFVEFDYILAMDRDNLAHLQAKCPPEHAHKLALFMSHSVNFVEREVPDPYYGGAAGFDRVLDMVQDASQGLLAHLRSRLG